MQNFYGLNDLQLESLADYVVQLINNYGKEINETEVANALKWMKNY